MLVSNRYDPDPRVHKEARSLVAAGYRVTVLAWDREYERPASEVRDGVRIQRLRARRAKPGDLGAAVVGLVSFHHAARKELLRSRPRAVHCHDHDTCAVGWWWRTLGARRAGVEDPRFVFDAHDLYWTWVSIGNPRSRWRRAAGAVLRHKDRFYARRADLLITATEGRGEQEGFAEIYRRWEVGS